MTEQTTSAVVIGADPDTVMQVIADFPAYPEWATGVAEAEVLSETAGRAERVRFVLDVSPIKDEYTLHYRWQGSDQVSWTLVEAKILTGLDGAYVLRDLGDGSTEVTYRLAIDLAIPLIGMIRRKGEKRIVETALTGLKKRVESI
jgi:ribosome-associated toxin RatA of RatAB toxin-antitoxin module